MINDFNYAMFVEGAQNTHTHTHLNICGNLFFAKALSLCCRFSCMWRVRGVFGHKWNLLVYTHTNVHCLYARSGELSKLLIYSYERRPLHDQSLFCICSGIWPAFIAMAWPWFVPSLKLEAKLPISYLIAKRFCHRNTSRLVAVALVSG